MYVHISFLSTFVISLALGLAANAQTALPDDTDIQSWNDFQLTIPINKRVDLSLTTTHRFGENLGRYNEGRVGVGVGVKLHKAVSAAAGYNYIKSRNLIGRFATEHRYHVNGVYKFPFKRLGLSHRSQYEYRIRGPFRGWRYRPSLTVEKSLPERFMSKAKIFVTEEPFYVSTTGKFSRNRLSVGIKKVVNDNFSLDIYYLRQNDSFSRPGDLHVIGTSWKFSL